MVEAAHPRSVIETPDKRVVQLKVHQCVWSGNYPGNSLEAIAECYRARVARAEIDVAMLLDSDFLVVHDVDQSELTDESRHVDQLTRLEASQLQFRDGTRPPFLSQVVDLIAREAYPTLLELDLKDRIAWPSPRVEELARLLEPVKDRVTFGGGAYWNLRSLHQVDPDLRLGFTPSDSFDWSPSTDPGAQLVSLVPGVKDIHVRLNSAIRVCQDGVVDLAEVLHSRGMLLDVWTLNAGQPHWRERLRGALELGADVITTETPGALSEAAAEV